MTTTSGRKSTYCFVVLNIPSIYLTTLMQHHYNFTNHFVQHYTKQNFRRYDQCYQEYLQWRIQPKYLHFWKLFWYHPVILEQLEFFQPKLWLRLNSFDRFRNHCAHLHNAHAKIFLEMILKSALVEGPKIWLPNAESSCVTAEAKSL